jgi:hypothetical protein
MKIKFDNRFKEVTERGTRKSVKKVRRSKIDYKTRRLNVVFGMFLLIIVGGLVLNYTNRYEPKVESKTLETIAEPIIVEAREPIARELPRVESVEDMITRYFGKDAKVAIAVAKAESGLRADALGDTNTKYPSAGIFQIRLLPERQITKEQMFSAEHNIEYAKMLFDKSGWKPWSAYNNGAYLKHLTK